MEPGKKVEREDVEKAPPNKKKNGGESLDLEGGFGGEPMRLVKRNQCRWGTAKTGARKESFQPD